MGKKTTIPEHGIPKAELIEEIKNLKEQDVNWHGGNAFGYVYHTEDEHKKFTNEVYSLYASTNALNPMAFPSLKKYEAEVVAMTADMLGGTEETVGSMTSGGTESILLAIKTYRDKAQSGLFKTKSPEMIMPRTAHPAFEKAAHYFGVKSVRISLNEDHTPNMEELKDAINKNTILLVGSACEYPRGMIDPIQEMAEIALDKKIGLHVDSCLGGFMLPWLKKLGYDIPPCDLSVEGVTSISADAHKYGYTAKGSSVLMFKDSSYQKAQYFAFADWPGGTYASPSLGGTRPGGIIAASWAAMRAMGQDGYLKYAKITMETTEKLMKAVTDLPELFICGRPDMTVFSFGAHELNPYIISDAMESRGWVMDKMREPRSLHLIVNPHQAAVTEQFAEDLKSIVEEYKEIGKRGMKKKYPEGSASLYGMIDMAAGSKLVVSKVKDYLADQFNEAMHPEDSDES